MFEEKNEKDNGVRFRRNKSIPRSTPENPLLIIDHHRANPMKENDTGKQNTGRSREQAKMQINIIKGKRIKIKKERAGDTEAYVRFRTAPPLS